MKRLAHALAALAFACAAAAHAETYECRGPDGKTLFTSDRSLCPGAPAREPRGRIQRASGAPPARPRAAGAPAARAALDAEAEANVWRTKRSGAEAELAALRARLAALQEVAGWCNRGHEVWATDADGLRHGVDCGQLAGQRKALAGEARRLEAYLDEGLEEECRRAGCLPGWIR